MQFIQVKRFLCDTGDVCRCLFVEKYMMRVHVITARSDMCLLSQHKMVLSGLPSPAQHTNIVFKAKQIISLNSYRHCGMVAHTYDT